MIPRLVFFVAVLTGCAGGPDSDRREADRTIGTEPVPSHVEAPASGTASSQNVAEATPAPSASTPLEEVPGPAKVEQIAVAGDLPASMVRGKTKRPILTVFLPGVCSNAYAYLASFTETARAAGGVVAIDGDKPCAGSPGFHTFAAGTETQHARIEAALVAAGVESIPPEGITLIGYSQGASIAERLAERWPERYQRIVLMGSPKDPSVDKLKNVRAVATMSCSLDVPPRMKGGAARLEKAGVPSAYFEMPGCTHGNIAEGDRVFGEVFAWLDERALPSKSGGQTVTLGAPKPTN
ncbi:MAG: alpha/beta hydrolase [Polyangiaceae bacterium]|nr:alpha/beta hydrolase [Polyangiaceae bacterium]